MSLAESPKTYKVFSRLLYSLFPLPGRRCLAPVRREFPVLPRRMRRFCDVLLNGA